MLGFIHYGPRNIASNGENGPYKQEIRLLKMPYFPPTTPFKFLKNLTNLKKIQYEICVPESHILISATSKNDIVDKRNYVVGCTTATITLGQGCTNFPKNLEAITKF